MANRNKQKYSYRLPRVSGILSALDDANVFQPSSVYRSSSLKTNPSDEDYIPEASIANFYDKRKAGDDLTVDQLLALSKQDEIEDAVDRITSYIAIVPELGTTFAYPQFSESFDIEPERRDTILPVIERNWNFVQHDMFYKYSSLVLGIHGFVHAWFIYGTVYAAIIRENKYGKILRIHIQYEPFKELKAPNGDIYWSTTDEQYIWEQEDLFILSYEEINPHVTSFVASLRYSYNTYKSIERTRIANAIMAAQFRSIYTVPTKGLGKTKARARLSSVMGLYKRTINIDRSSGEVLVNGENSYPVNTELWVSETSSGPVRIENPGDGNPQLSNTDLVEYFFRKFYKRSKLPISKYEAVNTGYLNGLSELDEDERQFKLTIGKHRSVLAKFFIKILWRYLSSDKDFLGNNDLESNLIFTFYDEPEHKTPEELLDGINDRMSKINDIIDTYLDTLEKSGFGESQRIARANVLRYKLMSKYLPDVLEQTSEDYRNVPEQEDTSTSSDSDFGNDDFSDSFGDDWSSESGYDDGNDSMDDFSDDDISNEVNFDDWDFDEMDDWDYDNE